MESHELLKDLLKETSAKQVASEMGLSLSLIYKWAEPPLEGSGANNPLDRIEQLIRITHDRRIAQWVCERAGGFFIANPDGRHGHRELMPATNNIIQEFADMLQVIAVAAGDQKITAEEARDIRGRWEELKSATEGFVQAAEQGRFSVIESRLKEPVRSEERK
ncbi:MAG: phage regulatory CII family protein [Opitutaceae bacterium]|nr:phage regulatory CII family protein [Opitutaceae bacterium]